MRSYIVPGAVFPDYELSDHREKRQKLSDLQQQDPNDTGAQPRCLLSKGPTTA